MILAIKAGFWFNVFRQFFAIIDSVIYKLLVSIYNLFTNISMVELFGESELASFSNRIYSILAVIMLFKIAFSIITYIVDPDKLSDSQKGFQSIVKNIVIMLVLIVSVPVVFKYARVLQHVVIEDNTIGRLVTGKSGNTSENFGEDLAVSVLAGFIRPNDSITDGSGNKVCVDSSTEDQCKEALNKIESGLGTTYYKAFNSTFKGSYKYLIEAAQSTAETSNGEYAIEYTMLLSPFAGGFVGYVLLLFCIDIALRTIKLGFLELIAPIPISTYMDNGSKTKIFSKWLEQTIRTYLSLFVKLLTVYFGIYVISTFIIKNDPTICTWNFDSGNNILTPDCHSASPIVVIFLILGGFAFMKELPKLISDITGIELDKNFTLNPTKRLTAIPVVGGAAAAGLGLAGSVGLSAGRLGFGTAKAGLGAGVNKLSGGRFGQSFSAGMGETFSRIKSRMGAGLETAKGNVSNWSGDGKYKSQSEVYNKKMENYNKGKDQFRSIDDNWVKGQKLHNKLLNDGFDYKDLNGHNEKAYKSVYSNQEFIDSLMNMDAQDAVNKEYINALYEAQAMGSSWDGATIIDAKGQEHNYSSADLKKLKEDAEKAQKTFSGLEKVHDTMRLKYSKDAERQDSLKTSKYNSENPTGISHKILNKQTEKANQAYKNKNSRSDMQSDTSSNSIRSSSTDNDSPSTPFGPNNIDG